MHEIGLAVMLAAKRSAGFAPEVNLREHITCMPLPSANKAAPFGFETQRRHHQKSKTGVSVAPKIKKSPIYAYFINLGKYLSEI